MRHRDASRTTAQAGTANENAPSRRRRRAIVAGLAAVAVGAGPVVATASSSPESLRRAPSTVAPAAKPSGMSSGLAAIAATTPHDDAFISQATSAGWPLAGPGSLVRDRTGRILVDATLTPGRVPSAAALAEVGAELVALARDEMMATIAAPATQLDGLAHVAGIRYLTEVLAPMRLGGDRPVAATAPTPQTTPDDFVANVVCGTGIVTEGDVQLDADDARSTFAVDGTGINVGIISDSYDDFGDAATDIANSELPGVGNPCGRTTPVDVLADADDMEPTDDVIDEGRAMAQIVHDLAPGAELSFATAIPSEIVMAQHIRDLATNGADIVTDDIAYAFEPMFQDGYIGAAINDNLDELGVPHFTAAGNSNLIIGGRDVASYEAASFRPMSCPGEVVEFAESCHDFIPGAGADNGNGFALASGGSVRMVFGWDEPQFGVTTDLDVYLVNSLTGDVVAGSNFTSDENGRPNEFVVFTNTTAFTLILDVVVGRFSGTGTPRFRHQFLRASGVTSVERDTSAGGDVVGPTIFGHAGTDTAISVGAVPFDDSTAVETFSSRGPNLICWEPLDGATPASAIAPCDITTIDIVATNGGANSFFGSEDGGVRRFFGTSAAAPHAAAVAALAMEHAPCATADEIVDAMQAAAVPVGAFGVDAIGAGLVDADATLTALNAVVGRPCAHLVASVTVEAGVASDPITIEVFDTDDGPENVNLTFSSSDPSTLPASALTTGGFGAARTLTITPPADVEGIVTITIEARDPGDNTSTFELEVIVGGGLVSTFTPSRLVDTRSGGTTVDGQFQAIGAIAGGSMLEVQIAGRGGVAVDATAAVLNLSTVNSSGNGFLTIYDCGTRPLASGINYGAGRVVNNEIVAKLSANGRICIFARTTTDLVVDAVGAAGGTSPYVALTPARLVETRVGDDFNTVDNQFEGGGPIAGGEVFEVQIAGRGGISTGAGAAVLNLSTVNSAGNGFLTIYDCSSRPLASGINYAAGSVVNNEIIAKLSASGRICIFARTTTDLVIDAVGEVPEGSYNARVPARLVETRSGPAFRTIDGEFEGDGAIAGNDEYEVQIAGRGGIPADATAAVLNLSTVDSSGNGFLTIYDCSKRPLASGINYAAGSVVNNEIIAKLSPTGTICIFARTTTHLVVDAVGDL